jgi:hypothetical protein
VQTTQNKRFALQYCEFPSYLGVIFGWQPSFLHDLKGWIKDEGIWFGVRQNRTGDAAAFWTAAGSGAPRRFGIHDLLHPAGKFPFARKRCRGSRLSTAVQSLAKTSVTPSNHGHLLFNLLEDSQLKGGASA